MSDKVTEQNRVIRKNFLRAVRFERPDYIPMTFQINQACWDHYDQNALQDLMEAHPFLLPDFCRQEKITPKYRIDQYKDKPYIDPWGCVWETSVNGITGVVVQNPLKTWDRFNELEAPDPNLTNGRFPIDWHSIRGHVNQQKKNGELVIGGLPHSHTFLRLTDIRGYENLMFDMFDEEPNLNALIKMIEDFNYQLVIKWLEFEPDVMTYPEDLGMQIGPMVSPENFRKYIKPVYQRLMKPARDKNCIVHMHSDGDIRTLVDDMIDSGVEIINLQDLVNGIDWIKNKFAGNVCIDLDIDRQKITAQGTPEEIDALIREEVQKLGSKEGGLIMKFGLYPNVPIENIKAVMDAMEKYATFYL